MQSTLFEILPASLRIALNDDAATDINVNSDGEVYAEFSGRGYQRLGQLSKHEANGLGRRLASLLDSAVTATSPVLEGELPGFPARVAIVMPPCVDAATISFRKKATQIFTLDDYVRSGIASEEQAETVRKWLSERLNILVVGGTSSGKTTFLNALIAETVAIHPHHRLVILEDTPEIQCPATNAIQMRSTIDVSLQSLVKTTLRHRPDRIIVGEVRGREALSLLKAWNTGHPGGLSTLHANSAEAGLIRLEQLISEANVPPMPTLIAEAVNAVIFIEKTSRGRVIKQMLEIKGFNAQNHCYEFH